MRKPLAPTFNYPAFLDMLVNHHHNYMRQWVWEPKQHLIGLSGQGAETLEEMLASPADWVAAGYNADNAYRTAPPAWLNQRKPSLLDSDHLGSGSDYKLVWTSFCAGITLR